MKEELIKKTKKYVEEFFKDDCGGHDYYHMLRVYNLAKIISEKEGGNQEIIALAALLHDVDDYKLVKRNKDPFCNAKKFLKENNVEEDKIEEICKVISTISYKGIDTVAPKSIEGKIVQDADRLDSIGAIGIGRVFAYGGKIGRPIYNPKIAYKENMTCEQYYRHVGTTINLFYERLLKMKELMNTKTAKEIAESRHNYMKGFLQEFYGEWNGKI